MFFQKLSYNFFENVKSYFSKLFLEVPQIFVTFYKHFLLIFFLNYI